MKGFLLALTVFAVPVLTAAPASAAPASSSLAVIGPFSVGAAEADALEAEFAAFTNASRVEIIYDEYVGAGDLEDRATGPTPPVPRTRRLRRDRATSMRLWSGCAANP